MHDGLIIPLAGIMLPLILVPTIITMAHRIKKREWQHKERLRALDLGLAPPATDHGLGGGTVIAIGAGVPVASVLAALITTLNLPFEMADYIPILGVVWGCALMLGFSALVTSLVLGVLVMRSRKPAEADQFAALKPSYEPDAYDVVSRRG